jgi:hypothetical protein
MPVFQFWWWLVTRCKESFPLVDSGRHLIFCLGTMYYFSVCEPIAAHPHPSLPRANSSRSGCRCWEAQSRCQCNRSKRWSCYSMLPIDDRCRSLDAVDPRVDDEVNSGTQCWYSIQVLIKSRSRYSIHSMPRFFARSYSIASCQSELVGAARISTQCSMAWWSSGQCMNGSSSHRI